MQAGARDLYNAESIFVDDSKTNAQAAYNLGITGILYKNPKSFQRALRACGIALE